MLLKLFQKEQFKKTAEANGDLIWNKIVNRISKNSPQNNSQTVEKPIEISPQNSISPEKRQQIIDDLRL